MPDTQRVSEACRLIANRDERDLGNVKREM